MNKAIRLVQNYLIVALPFVLICMTWSSLRSGKSEEGSWMMSALWESLSWNLIIWFAVLVLFLILLVIDPGSRKKTLSRLANIKERDEREEYLTGKAARSAYLSTISLVVLFLFFSVFGVSLTRNPEKTSPDGRDKSLQIGMRFDLVDRPSAISSSDEEVLFQFKQLPISKTGILLTVLVWLLASFNLSARKESSLAG